tara:strand:- start:3162 stop:3728 length:567 start_codon:yes stop_codon:yes gene_type:complete
MIIIHKTFSKTDLIDLINDLDLSVRFNHQDNKKNIQDKLLECLSKPINDINKNFYNIENKDGLLSYLQNQNPKKILNIKEKKGVMLICRHIIQYCKNKHNLKYCKYKNLKDLQDDMDYIKQFGDIPSVRRSCRLMNQDPQFKHYKFNALISPQIQMELEEKKVIKNTEIYSLKIRKATPENPIIIDFN